MACVKSILNAIWAGPLGANFVHLLCTLVPFDFFATTTAA